MHRTFLIVMATVSALAFAGKVERDFANTDVQPAINAAQDAFKKACGCPLSISAKLETFKTKDALTQVKNTAESITQNAEKYCTDAESKKAMCKLKNLTCTNGTDVKFEFSGSRGIATTNSQSFVAWEQITQELDN